jgi:hypothetical protein
MQSGEQQLLTAREAAAYICKTLEDTAGPVILEK